MRPPKKVAIPKVRDRYELKEIIGRGGMGLVYRAYDTVIRRDVALKTIRDIPDRKALELFRKECGVLASISHPNIIEIFDIGEFEEGGESKPYFVMPLLPGLTLDQLIRNAPDRLTVERSIEIICQTCRGLHAAHENGLVHRDMKPSNIFVMQDDSVKIIDFGVAHMADSRNTMTIKGGTLPYMAPEQLMLQQASPLSDLFSLGVVLYETLTRRRPFDGHTEAEIAESIKSYSPPPVSELNLAASQTVSRVVHKAIAKQPFYRFANVKEFSENLQKALRNERIEFFDPIRIQPRIRRAIKAIEQRDYQFASEIVAELEAEGHLDPDIPRVRRQIESGERQRTILQLLDSARTRIEEGEFLLAQQKIDELLRLDPTNVDALTLKGNLEVRRNEHKIDEWLHLTRQHLDNQAFRHARSAIQKVLQLKPEEPRAMQMLTEIDRREQEYLSIRKEKEDLYQSAREAWQRGEVSAALAQLEQCIELDRRAPDTSPQQRDVSIESFYDEVLGEHDAIRIAYEEARKSLEDRSFIAALTICDQYLAKYPGHKLFQPLKLNVEESQRQEITDLLQERHFEEAMSRLERLKEKCPGDDEVARLYRYARGELEAQARARSVNRAAEEVTALTEAKEFDAALAILDEALKEYPGQGSLLRLLGTTMAAKGEWDHQMALQAAASECEMLRSHGHFAAAIQRGETAVAEHGAEPTLVALLQQFEKEWEQQRRSEAVRKTAAGARNLLGKSHPESAIRLIRQVLNQYPDEPELAELMAQAEAGLSAQERTRAIESLVREAELYRQTNDFDRALELLAHGLERWPGDETLLRQQRADEQARTDRNKQQDIAAVILEATRLRLEKQFAPALSRLAITLSSYPAEPVLTELLARVRKEQAEHIRQNAVEHVARDARELLSAGEVLEAASLLKEGTQRYPEQPELEALAVRVDEELRKRERAAAIEKLVRDAHQLTEAGEVDRAFRTIEQGLEIYAEDPILVREFEMLRPARAAWLRSQAVADILTRAEQLKFEGHLAEAVQLITASLTEYEKEPLLLEAHQRLDLEWTAEKRREEVLKSAAAATSMIENGQLGAATEFLRAICARYPGEPEVESLRSRAGELLRRQERAEAILAVDRESKALAARHEFDAAFGILAEGLRAWPADEALLSIQQSLLHEKELWENQEVLCQCEDLAGQGRFEEALQLLDGQLDQRKSDSRLWTLRGRLEQEWQYQKRSNTIAKTLVDVAGLIAQGRLDDALHIARESCRKYPGEADLESVLARAEQEFASRQQRERFAKEGEALIVEGRFEEAIRSLQEAVARFPRDTTLAMLQSRAQSGIETQERGEVIEELRKDAERLANAHNYDGALVLLERGLRNWPAEKVLRDVQKEVRISRAAWQRAQALREKLRTIDRFRRENMLTEALVSITAALAEFPNHPSLLELQRQVHKAKVLNDAQEFVEQGNPSFALALLQDLATENPSDPDVANLIAQSSRDILAREHSAAIENACVDARTKAEANDFDGAWAAIEKALAKWPEETSLREARVDIVQAKKLWQRNKAISDAAKECEQLESEGRLDEALETIQRFRNDLRAEPALVRIKERLETKLEERQQQERLQNDIKELQLLEEAAVHTSDLSEVVQMLDKARKIIDRYHANGEVRSVDKAPLRHLSDIVQAAEELGKGNFSAVLEICRKYLEQYPNHVICTDLNVQAETGAQIAYVAGLQLTLNGETNLQNRERLLQEGLNRYPDEPWICDELKATGIKLGLVASIVKRASAQEAKSEWKLALAEWKKIVPIYPEYPGIDRIIARLEKEVERWRGARVQHLVDQVTGHLNAGDFERASRELEPALAEFPEEAAIQDAGALIEDAKKRIEQARGLLSDGEAAFQNGSWDGGIAKLRLASELDRTDAALERFRSVIIKYARQAVPRDWRAAERMMSAIATINPKFAAPEDLASAIADARREEIVRNCVVRAEELRANEQLADALAEVERGVANCPGEPRLEERRQAILNDIRAAREGIIQELRAIEQTAPITTTLLLIAELRLRVRTITELNRSDREVTALVDRASRALDSRKRWLYLARLTSNRKLGIAAGVVVLIGGILGLRSPSLVTVQVTSSPPGAAITTEGQSCAKTICEFRLGRGDHSFTADLEGYGRAAPTIHVDQRQVPPLEIVLMPLQTIVHISTNFRSGQVTLDGSKAGELRNGAFERKEVGFGKHELVISGTDGAARVIFETSRGHLPVVRGAVDTKEAVALVISSLGHKARVDCNCTSEILLDGKRMGNVGPLGFEVSDLGEGSRELKVGERTVAATIRPEPAIHVVLTSDRDIGTLVVVTNVENPTVIVNKKRYVGGPRENTVQLQLDSGDYKVEVQKNGYIHPAAQSAQIAKGLEVKRFFQLVREDARLLIPRDAPGTPVTTQPGASVPIPPADLVLREEVEKRRIEEEKRRTEEEKLRTEEEKRRTEEENAWRATDKSNPRALQQFLDQYPKGPYSENTKRLIRDLQTALDEQKRQESIEAQKKSDQKRLAEQAQADVLKKAANDVIKAVSSYADAYRSRNLDGMKKLYPFMPTSTEQTYKSQDKFVSSIQYTLDPEEPAIAGSTAKVRCRRSVAVQIRGSKEKVKPNVTQVLITLVKDQGRWLIKSID